MKKRTFLIFMSAVFAVLMAAAIPTGLQLGAVAMAARPPSGHRRSRRGAALFRPLRQLGFQPASEGSRRYGHCCGRWHRVYQLLLSPSPMLTARASAPLLLQQQLMRRCHYRLSRSTTAGAGYSAPVVDHHAIATRRGRRSDATIADATIGGTLTGGIRKFVDNAAWDSWCDVTVWC